MAITRPIQNQELIRITNLVMRFGDRTVLNGLNFNVRRGETFVILGGSGSGKTTLLRNLVGLLLPNAGTIVFNGRDFTKMTDRQRIDARKRMGMCFQGSALIGSMTVGENVALPLLEHTRLEQSTIDIMVKIKLELVGLGGFENYLPSELSGGMKKRAGLARAMAMDPQVIFYDEPSAGLDPVVAAGLDVLIRKLQHTFSLTSVIVTHELPSVEVIADRVLLLHRGRVAALGTLDEVKNTRHPYVQQFFERRASEESADEEAYIQSLTGGIKVKPRREGGF
jgi:phospholipid/cholesterol/gamma-HCH transport system ATP-binding protein